MYTGTVIQDLMAMVDRVAQKADQRRIAEEQELHEIFSMQIPINEGTRVLMGAA
ncbi:MAG TPA: hypothetical protein VKV39_11425 [Candidatus Sulfotelmatobacter sp.]|nr:hypothetical protein [Candidatus Sulfotelmatobacter sp.]